MYKRNKIGVVVPAYNEGLLIVSTIIGIPKYVDKIIAVDDASTDSTYQKLQSLRTDKRLIVLRHKKNQGVGASKIDGYKKLMSEKVDIAVAIDGDNQMDPKYLPKLLDKLIQEDFDVAKGNRFLHTKELKSMPLFRFLGSIFVTFLTKLASGYWSIFDVMNGYVASRISTLRLVSFDRVGKRYDFEVSMLINLNIIGATITDVPIPAVYGDEVSHIKLWRVLPRFLNTVFLGFWQRIFFKYVFPNTHPVALFLIFGLLLSTAGLVIGIWAILITGGHPTASTALLAVTPFLLGFQLMLTAVIMDMQNEPNKKPK